MFGIIVSFPILKFIYCLFIYSTLPSASLLAKRMDLLYFDTNHKVIVCQPCQYALVPDEIANHLHSHHKAKEALTNSDISNLSQRFLAEPFDPPETIKRIQLPPDALPIPYLALYHNGFCCRLCPSTKPYVCRSERVIAIHLKQVHHWSRQRGRQSKTLPSEASLAHVAIFPVACQTFYKRNTFIRYFVVKPGSSAGSAGNAQAA